MSDIQTNKETHIQASTNIDDFTTTTISKTQCALGQRLSPAVNSVQLNLGDFSYAA